MSSSRREEIQRDFDALRTVVSRIVGHSYDAQTTPARLNLLERLEHEMRRLRAPGHELTNQLAEQAGPDELGGPLPHALADRLRITRAEARRRVADAADLGPRRALTGEALPPLLTATAAAERDGTIDPAHVRVIRRFSPSCLAVFAFSGGPAAGFDEHHRMDPPTPPRSRPSPSQHTRKRPPTFWMVEVRIFSEPTSDRCVYVIVE